MRGSQLRLRSSNAEWQCKTSGRVVAISDRTIAQALMQVPEPLLAVLIGCTPQYPPSQKYKSTEAAAEDSRKCALMPIHRSSVTHARVAALVRLDQRPVALINDLAE